MSQIEPKINRNALDKVPRSHLKGSKMCVNSKHEFSFAINRQNYNFSEFFKEIAPKYTYPKKIIN